MRRDVLRVVEVELAGRRRGAWKVRRVEEPTDAQRRAWALWMGRAWDA